MTCKDCVHYEVCQVLRYGDITNCDSDGCGGYFKPKSRFVELPCEVGDYLLWDNGIEIQKKKVKGFYFNPNDLGLRYILEDVEPIVNHSCIKGILSREAAEKALKERESE